MKTSDFYYDLPEELIAQTPIEPRNASRLMVLNKKTGEVEHKIFKDLTNYLNPGDCLIQELFLQEYSVLKKKPEL